MIDMELAWKRYNNQKYRCDKGMKLDAADNPVEMRMTFAEWLMVWIESGQYHLYGRGKGKYCMSRHNDIGPYEVGNVRIITNEENVSEAQKGIPKGKPAWNKGITPSAETCAKISASMKGKPSPNKGKPSPKISAALKGKPSPLKGRLRSEETKAKMRKPKSAEAKANMRKPKSVVHISKLRKPKLKIQCPHCGMWGGSNGMKRYHFDNCKAAPK